MRILDVGCGAGKAEGRIGIDRFRLPGVDVLYDLNSFPWPFANGAFDQMYMNNVIEHLGDTVRVMEEAYRLLKTGGKLHIRVPYWNHKCAASDPTHVKYFSEISFMFFTGQLLGYYYTTARFELERLEYIYDIHAKKLFFSQRLMDYLSYFLCNIRQEMKITLVKI